MDSFTFFPDPPIRQTEGECLLDFRQVEKVIWGGGASNSAAGAASNAGSSSKAKGLTLSDTTFKRKREEKPKEEVKAPDFSDLSGRGFAV